LPITAKEPTKYVSTIAVDVMSKHISNIQQIGNLLDVQLVFTMVKEVHSEAQDIIYGNGSSDNDDNAGGDDVNDDNVSGDGSNDDNASGNGSGHDDGDNDDNACGAESISSVQIMKKNISLENHGDTFLLGIYGHYFPKHSMMS
jgi:hypothetical protein